MQNPAPANRLMVWWILWFAILSGLVIIFQVLRPSAEVPSPQALRYLPLLPFAFGIFIRWVLLPRATGEAKALPLFLVGLALSESCGIPGIVLVPEMRSTYFLLALIGVFQYVPFFASRFHGK